MDNRYMLIGTFTKGGSKGIYIFGGNEAEPEGVVEVMNPSYLTVDRSGKHIYCVSENSDVPSYAHFIRFDANTKKHELADTIGIPAEAPTFITVSPDGKYCFIANYGTGSVSVVTLKDDGSFGQSQLIQFEGRGMDPQRQEGPHCHCVCFSPDDRFFFITDLGTDRIYRFDMPRDGAMVNEHTMKIFRTGSGLGPRHAVFHPGGKYFYVISEVTSAVLVFRYDNGELLPMQTVMLTDGNADGGGGLAVTSDGKYLYASKRRGNDGIYIFSISDLGLIIPGGFVKTGEHPRSITIGPEGDKLYCTAMEGNTVEIYDLDREHGSLRLNKKISVDMPVCVGFIPGRQ